MSQELQTTFTENMKRSLEAFAEKNFRLLFAKQNEQMESDGVRVSVFRIFLCIVTNPIKFYASDWSLLQVAGGDFA